MTDERQGVGLWAALERLPRGAGVVFRHYATSGAERRALFARILRVARRRGLVLVRGGDVAFLGEQGVHGRRGMGLVTWSAHDRAQAIDGVRAGAEVLFVSPLFTTRSHPGQSPVGPLRAATLARGLAVTVIALGGMDERRFARIGKLGFDGYAAIDGWDGAARSLARATYQKRKAVPT